MRRRADILVRSNGRTPSVPGISPTLVPLQVAADKNVRAPMVNEIWKTDSVITHTACLARSLKHWTGRELMPGVTSAIELAQEAFEATFVLMSHGMEADPVLNYRSVKCPNSA